MDLGECPRCGVEWLEGSEICTNCRFVPIGAGLKDHVQPKKKKKLRPYREPGSATPFLLFLAFVGGFGSVIESKPWQDNWDKVRAFFSGEQIHSIKGDWRVVRLLQMNSTESGPFKTANIDGASLSFQGKGKVVFRLDRDGHEVDATGQYEQIGRTVHVSELKASDNGETILPAEMELPISWEGDSEATMRTSQVEEAYLTKQTDTELVAYRDDRVTTAYANDEGDARGMLTKSEGDTP